MTTDRPSTPGRPRDGGLDAKVLSATVATLRDKGLSGTRIDEISRRAGVPKSSIYRRWPTVSALVLDAMVDAVGHARFDPTGDPYADLLALAELISPMLCSPEGVLLLRVGVQIMDDPNLASAYRARVIDPNRQAAIDLIHQGQADGRFNAHLDPVLLVDQVIGAMVYRVLVLHESVGRSELGAAMQDALARLTAGNPSQIT